MNCLIPDNNNYEILQIWMMQNGFYAQLPIQLPYVQPAYGTIRDYDWTPYAERRVVPKEDNAKDVIDVITSNYIEDYETASNMIRVAVADMIIAVKVAQGHAFDFFPCPYNLEPVWNETSPLPYIAHYTLIHRFPNRVAAAEKVFHEAKKDWSNPWGIELDDILQDSFGNDLFRQKRNPLLDGTLTELPGEQSGVLEQFRHIVNNNTKITVTVPIRGIFPSKLINNCLIGRNECLPWNHYPLYGLDALHHSGKKLVCLTPSITEALLNRCNSEIPMVSWLGGPETIELVDFEPLKGHTVVYLVNPNTFFTAQEAIDCLERVEEVLKKKDISLQMAVVEEEPQNRQEHLPSDERFDEIYNHTSWPIAAEQQEETQSC